MRKYVFFKCLISNSSMYWVSNVFFIEIMDMQSNSCEFKILIGLSKFCEIQENLINVDKCQACLNSFEQL